MLITGPRHLPRSWTYTSRTMSGRGETGPVAASGSGSDGRTGIGFPYRKRGDQRRLSRPAAGGDPDRAHRVHRVRDRVHRDRVHRERVHGHGGAQQDRPEDVRRAHEAGRMIPRRRTRRLMTRISCRRLGEGAAEADLPGRGNGPEILARGAEAVEDGRRRVDRTRRRTGKRSAGHGPCGPSGSISDGPATTPAYCC